MKGMSAPAVHEQWQVPHDGSLQQGHVPLRNPELGGRPEE